MGKAVLRVKILPKIKKSKPFYVNDLIIYSALAIFLILLFIAVIFKHETDTVHGFYVIYNNEQIAEYSFASGTLKITDGNSDYLSQKEDGIYFYPNGTASGEYNLIVADDLAKTVRVTASTCAGHDCERQKITAEGGFIYCAPHNLKITAMGFTNPVTG